MVLAPFSIELTLFLPNTIINCCYAKTYLKQLQLLLIINIPSKGIVNNYIYRNGQHLNIMAVIKLMRKALF